MKEESFLIVPAILIGIIAAVAAVGFHELIHMIRDLLYERPGQAHLYSGYWLLLLVFFPALGGLTVGVISRQILRSREGHGIADVMESVIRTSGFIKPVAAIEKILTSAITIGTGGSAGAEGPIVQIGAAISSGVGQVFRFARHQMPVIVGCGSAAGISAIFNAPIGGVLFTLEVILQDFSIRTFTPLVVSSVIANVTTRAIFERGGNVYPAIFAMPVEANASALQTLTWGQVGNFVVLGIFCGVAGVALTKLMAAFERLAHRFTLVPRTILPALGAGAMGLIGVVYVLVFGRLLMHSAKPFSFAHYPMPAFYGDGYGVIQVLLQPRIYSEVVVWKLLLLLGFLCIAKLIATSLCLSSGGSGGVIAPSLFIGATTGGLLGTALRQVPAFKSTTHPEIYALVGMGAVLAAVVHAPLASIIILFELTADYRVTLPAMLATVSAVGIARLISPDSIYTGALRARGVRWGTSAERTQLRRTTVEQVDLEPASVIQAGDSFQRLLELTEQLRTTNFVVIDSKGDYQGMVVEREIDTVLAQREAVPLLVVREIMRTDIKPVRSSDDLGSVFELFAQLDLNYLPVCLDSRPEKVIGLIGRVALMRKYRAGA